MKRYDFNNILSSKTAPSVVEKFDVNIQLYSTEILHELLGTTEHAYKSRTGHSEYDGIM